MKIDSYTSRIGTKYQSGITVLLRDANPIQARSEWKKVKYADANTNLERGGTTADTLHDFSEEPRAIFK